jgi:hypothetical protein
MSKFNLSTTYPIIPNANQYLFEKKYISIHSEDRNIIKYPNASEFEIELPQDYLNVQSVKLASWSLPSCYDVFSIVNANLKMVFKFIEIYDPSGTNDPLQNAIYAGLNHYLCYEYCIFIEEGNYDYKKMAIELTNKFNQAVTFKLIQFFNETPEYEYALSTFTEYDQFVVVFNDVNGKFWFGNKSSQFVLMNNSDIYYCDNLLEYQCIKRNIQTSFNYWGLPSYLGFTRCNDQSMQSSDYPPETTAVINTLLNGTLVPRFYYDKNVNNDGFWLVPNLPNANVYYLVAPLKPCLLPSPFIYMEIKGLNCIDETCPYNLTHFTQETNETNGVVNSSFAKIPLNLDCSCKNNGEWSDGEMVPYKWFNPPAERIRKLHIKMRYHNGQLVNFGNCDYTVLLEFNLLRPQNEKNISVRGFNGV